MPNSIKSEMLFDFQVNGFAGIDFQRNDLSDKEILHAIGGLLAHDTGAILFTLITDTIDALCRKLERIETIRSSNQQVADVIRGYHLEGPWISDEPGYHGAHPAELTRPASPKHLRLLSESAGGNLKLITLAPEVKGCLTLIEDATHAGIRVSLGHTNASERAIDEAIQAGATLATHLGNAVPEQTHRHDNVMQRLLARDELIACLIPDGIHLPPYVLKNFFRAKPVGKTFFTTDCMAAAGAAPGQYTVGPHTIHVGEDRIVRLPGDTRFAGSSLTMDEGVKNIQEWLQITESKAHEMCSTLPAAHFGITL